MTKRHLVIKVDALRSKLTVDEACKKAGISVPTYYYYKKGPKKAAKGAAKREKAPKIQAGSMLILVIPPKNAKAILKHLSGLAK